MKVEHRVAAIAARMALLRYADVVLSSDDDEEMVGNIERQFSQAALDEMKRQDKERESYMADKPSEPKDDKLVTTGPTAVVKTPEQEAEDLQKFLFYGDLSGLSKPAQNEYLFKLAKAMGLNPWMRPFDMLILNGKVTVYANKGAAQQLRNVYHISLNQKYAGPLRIGNRFDERVYEVEIEASRPDQYCQGGFRFETEIGTLPIAELQGEALSNAIMKCVTKAKRRATLSISEVALPDESEIENMQRYTAGPDQPQRVAPKPLPIGSGTPGPGPATSGGVPLAIVGGEAVNTQTGEILDAEPIVAPRPVSAPPAATPAAVPPPAKATVSRFPPAVPPVGVKPVK